VTLSDDVTSSNDVIIKKNNRVKTDEDIAKAPVKTAANMEMDFDVAIQ